MPVQPPQKNRDIDIEMQKSYGLLHRLRLISDRRIKLWHALLITVFFAGFVAAIVWSISEEHFTSSQAQQTPTVVTNLATVTYEDSTGNSFTSQSNSVSTTISPNTADISAFKQLANNHSGQVSVTIHNTSSGNQIAELTTTVDANGNGSIVVPETYISNSYDLGVKADNYLSKVTSNITLEPLITLSFGTMLTGDLVNDDKVNALDFSFMNNVWFTNNAQADYNQDGIVNTLDFGTLNSNFGKLGEKQTNL